MDPSKARRPDPGMLAGVGRQAGKAKLGSGTKTLLTQHILKTKVSGGGMEGGKVEGRRGRGQRRIL